MTRLRHARRILRALERPGFTIIVFYAMVVGLLQRGHLPSAAAQVAVTVAMLAWLTATTALNDVADEAIDRVNLVDDPRRVLVTGLASRRQLLAVSLLMSVLAVAAASVGGLDCSLVMVGGIALSAAYSLRPLRLSDRGLLTSLLLPVGYVAMPLLLGACAGGPVLTWRGDWALGGLAVAITGRLALKDFRDLDGDRLFGKRTLLVRHGRRTVCAFAATLSVVGSVPLLMLTSVSPVIAVDGAVLSVLTLALVGSLALSDRGDRRTISDVALLGRGQLAIVAVAVAIPAHRLSVGAAALASTSILLCTLYSSWIDHSRLRYEPAGAPSEAESPLPGLQRSLAGGEGA